MVIVMKQRATEGQIEGVIHRFPKKRAVSSVPTHGPSQSPL